MGSPSHKTNKNLWHAFYWTTSWISPLSVVSFSSIRSLHILHGLTKLLELFINLKSHLFRTSFFDICSLVCVEVNILLQPIWLEEGDNPLHWVILTAFACGCIAGYYNGSQIFSLVEMRVELVSAVICVVFELFRSWFRPPFFSNSLIHSVLGVRDSGQGRN